MRPRRLLPAGLPAFSMAVALAATAFADDVVLVPNANVKGAIGGRVRGTVEAESPSEVTVRLNAANTTTIPTGEIASISYTGQPATILLAENKESAGSFVEAAELYKKASGESDKPFVKQAALFHQANVLAELAFSDSSHVAEATKLLQSFVQANPTSRHIVSALDNLARLQLQKGDYAAVEKTIAEMSKQPQSTDRAAVLRAKVFAKQGNFEKAIVEYDRLIKSSPENSFRQRQARLAKAESLAGLKKFDEARTEVRSVIKSTPAEDVQTQSAAYNTLGDCLRAAGNPKEALDAYLHTDILYSKDKEQHPRALAHISQLWRVLKRDDRAEEVWEQLKKEYPKSQWLTAAR